MIRDTSHGIFDWFDAELASVKTRGFLATHSHERPETISLHQIKLPHEYVLFTQKYGATGCFRISSLSYQLEIFSPAPRTLVKGNTPYVILGMTESAYIVCEYSSEDGSCKDVIDEMSQHGQLRRTGLSFAEWFHQKYHLLKKRLGKGKWVSIQKGPRLFTESELAVIEARKLFKWEVVDTSCPSSPTFSITNHSARVLSYITINFRAVVPSLFLPYVHSGIFLATNNIKPGETRLIKKDLVYHGQAEYAPGVVYYDPEFMLPEEREYLWEFKCLDAAAV